MKAARWFVTAGAAALAAASVLFAAAPALAADCPAGAGDCSVLASAGSFGASIDLVIVGDGYTTDERDKFFADAQKAADGLLNSETYGAYRPVWNAWALYTPSNQSGADDPSAGKLVDTAYGATYDVSGIDYLLAVNDTKVFNDVSARIPEADLIVCIVNATAYGGSGGPIAVVSLNQQSLEIARHEIGHTFANLADEYSDPYPGFPDGDPEPNVALTEHLDPVKWDVWLTPSVSIPTPIGAAQGNHDPIGAYEGARYKTTGVFRPAPNCLMRALDVTFCPVCSEAMVLRFSELSLLIDAPVPASPAVIAGKGATTFTATIPALSDLQFTWSIDGQMVAGEAGKSLAVDPAALGLADGAHTVELSVYDATPLVRSDPDGVMKETFAWSVTVDSNLPPATGSGGSGGSGGEGGAGVGGGTGGSDNVDTICTCRFAGHDGDAPMTWLLFGLVPLAHGLRRRSRDR